MKPRRHRYAEKAADELDALESERAEILDSSTKNAVPDTSVETQRENTTSAINVLDEEAKNRKKLPTQKNQKAPVKPKPSKPEGDPYELTITVREGPHKTDTPDTGEGTYRLLSDGKQVGNVLAHFNLAGKVVRVTKPTESRPTLQIRLKETLSQLKSDGLLNAEPLRIRRALPSREGNNPELWAHLP